MTRTQELRSIVSNLFNHHTTEFSLWMDKLMTFAWEDTPEGTKLPDGSTRGRDVETDEPLAPNNLRSMKAKAFKNQDWDMVELVKTVEALRRTVNRLKDKPTINVVSVPREEFLGETVADPVHPPFSPPKVPKNWMLKRVEGYWVSTPPKEPNQIAQDTQTVTIHERKKMDNGWESTHTWTCRMIAKSGANYCRDYVESLGRTSLRDRGLSYARDGVYYANPGLGETWYNFLKKAEKMNRRLEDLTPEQNMSWAEALDEKSIGGAHLDLRFTVDTGTKLLDEMFPLPVVRVKTITEQVAELMLAYGRDPGAAFIGAQRIVELVRRKK